MPIADRGLLFEQRAQRVRGGAELDPRDVASRVSSPWGRCLTMMSRTPRSVSSRPCALIESCSSGRSGCRRRADRAGRDLDVLFADRAHHVTGGEVARRDLVRDRARRASRSRRRRTRMKAWPTPGMRRSVSSRTLQQWRSCAGTAVVAVVGRQQEHDQRQVRRLTSGSSRRAGARPRAAAAAPARRGSAPAPGRRRRRCRSRNVTLERHHAVARRDRLHVDHASTPLIASSSGAATVSASTFGFAPG
jgi:hypothetical protein